MFATIDEARAIYLAELREYRAWIEERKGVYGGNTNPMAHWDNHDYEKVMKWNAVLQFSERLLALTDEEKIALDHEAGIKHWDCEHALKACCKNSPDAG